MFFIHDGGWDDGYDGIYDSETNEVIIRLDFRFDMGYMFNACYVDDHDLLIFDDHLPGKGKDLITVYDLHTRACLLYREEYTERTYNGEKSVTVNKDGRDIIIF